MNGVEIPLAGIPEAFSIALNGTLYELAVQWRNSALGGWFLDIADSDGNPLISGIAMITGANLLEQYSYLGLAGGAGLYITNSAGGDAAPTFDNLGTDAHLMLVIS
jgi:hypothetical protein